MTTDDGKTKPDWIDRAAAWGNHPCMLTKGCGRTEGHEGACMSMPMAFANAIERGTRRLLARLRGVS